MPSLEPCRGIGVKPRTLKARPCAAGGEDSQAVFNHGRNMYFHLDLTEGGVN